MNAAPAAPNLLVPMNVDALAVGADWNSWMLHVPDFATGMNQGNFLGYQQLAADMWQESKCPYQPGVHLRWALPDGIAQGSAADGGEPDYIQVPDRWAIVRLSGAESQTEPPGIRAWMVESDFVSETPAGTTQWPVMPTTSDRTPASFQYVRYVGRQLDFRSWPSTAAASYLGDLHAKLTAVGYGSATFAAYYPVCSSVFGFVDDLSDFPGASAGNSVQLTYLVAGWYFDPAADVLSGHANTNSEPHRWQDRMASLRWAWYDETPDGDAPPPPVPQPTSTIIHGFVSQVTWTGPGTRYGYGHGRSVSPKLAVGSSSLDALAAVLAANPSGDLDGAELERLLVAFQNDILSIYDKDADAATIVSELDELLHAASFGSRSTGTVYEIRRADANAPASAAPSGDAAAAIALPGDLGDQLTAINRLQSAADTTAAELTSHRQQYFYVWHKRADSVAVDDAVLPRIAGNITAATESLRDLTAQVDGAKKAIKDSLARYLPGYELVPRSGARYWCPSDISLLVTNAGRTFRQGEDGQYSQTGNLPCRVTGDTLTALRLTPADGNPVLIQTDEITADVPPHAADAASRRFDKAISPDLGALLLETVLLDPDLAMYLAGKFGQNAGVSVAALAASIRACQAINWNAPADQTLPDLSGYRGRTPCPAAVTYWLSGDGTPGNPWVPIMMQWQLAWYPAYQSGPGVPGALQAWSFDGTDYRLDPGYQPPAEPVSTLDGITVVTPTPVWNLQRRLVDYNIARPDNPDSAAIEELISALSTIDVLSQNAGGANLSLTMLDQTLQLPPISRDTGGLAEAADGGTVVDLIDRRYETAPWAAARLAVNQYFPIRAGHVRVTRVNVVDAFGQFVSLPDDAVRNPTVSTQLASAVEGQHVQLRPRLSQHARLLLSFVSAADDAVVTGPDPATTPVCGWLIVNHLDQSLLLSSARGAVLGKLRLDARQLRVLWDSDPVPGSAEDAPAWPIANPHLRALRAGLLQLAGADFWHLLSYLEQVEEKINPPGSQVNSKVAALMGMPIAVVRAGLQIQLDGAPVHDQSEATDKPEDHGYSEIGYPIALGDLSQLDDGLFGYFTPPAGAGSRPTFGDGAFGDEANGDGTDYGTLYVPGGGDVSSWTGHFMVQPDPDRSPVRLAPYANGEPAAPAYVTLLMDPRLAVKARTGVLPAKAVTLPVQDTSAVLASHELFLQSNPVLTSAREFAMPHPAKSYGTWSWLTLQRDPGSHDGFPAVWRETTDFGQRTGSAGLPVYPLLIRDGWLRLRVPSASGAAIIYFTVVGGTSLVAAGNTVQLTWAAQLPDSGHRLQLKAGEGPAAQVPNQSPGFPQAIQATTNFTLTLMKGDDEVDQQQLTVRVLPS
jgi:hypothetical protein